MCVWGLALPVWFDSMKESGSDAGFDDGWRRRGVHARASCMPPKPTTCSADSQQKAWSTPSPESSSVVLISGLDTWDSNEYIRGLFLI